jgi:23S rRNA pseudouridine2457 synthase
VLIAFHKPYGVLSQFKDDGSPHRTLAQFGFPKRVYPIGRLDADSEGLLLLSDEPKLNGRLLHPSHAHEREYWAQVEHIPTPEGLARLSRGVTIQGRRTLACRVWLLDPQPKVEGEPVTPCALQAETDSASGGLGTARPCLPPRQPPIRFRKTVPTCWIGLELLEGKNRQVRRMTATIGHPTLRLIRVRIGKFQLGVLGAGQWRRLNPTERALVLA